MTRASRLWAFLAGALAIAGCESNDVRERAALATADPQTVERLKAALADAMGVARVELGAGDLTAASTVSVLPPALGPHEDRSLAVPTQFDIVLEGDRCLAVRRDTGEEHVLEGIACRALAP